MAEQERAIAVAIRVQSAPIAPSATVRQGAKDLAGHASVYGLAQPGESAAGIAAPERRSRMLIQREEIRVTKGELEDLPRTVRSEFEVGILDAFTDVELAERIGRGDLFTRRAGERPYQVTRRTTGVLDEQEQYNALFHVPKPDTQASLRIVRINPQSKRASDAPVAPEPFEVICETAEFLLQDAQEVDSEKFQIVNTFDAPRIHFMGRRARVFSYSGILANSFNLQWKNRFLDMYDRYLRGSRAVSLRAVAQLIYDDVLREGYILSNTIAPSQSLLNAVPFSFTMFVTRTVSLADAATVNCPESELLLSRLDTKSDVERPRITNVTGLDPGLSLSARASQTIDRVRAAVNKQAFDEKTGKVKSFAGTVRGQV
jgi:hypothetical protein